MRQFEYKQHRIVTFIDILPYLQHYGKEGWQLVQIVDKYMWLMREIIKPGEQDNELSPMQRQETDAGEFRYYTNNTQSK